MTHSASHLKHHVSNEIRAELARQRLTHEWLADETGMTRTTLYRRLSGKSPFLADEIFNIANALNVDVANFFALSDEVA